MRLDTRITTPSIKDLRIFSIVLFILLAGISIWQLILGRQTLGIIFGAASIIVMALLLLKIDLLIPVYKSLVIISRAISLVLTPVIFGLIYYLIFTPMGLLMRLFRNDPLDKNFKKQSSSFWIDRKDKTLNPSDYERQY